ncbi:MAG TPA: hypothetical protein VFI12_05935 [Thermomicrobiales bacterium]|jgi:hypothetical protein|nr:hypothetical protein [Thermomicrobiales bacterium]
MHRTLIVVAIAALGLGAGGYALAQDAGTPAATELCATPGAGPSGTPAASPVAVAMATAAAGVPGANVGPAPSPTLLYECATPTK